MLPFPKDRAHNGSDQPQWTEGTTITRSNVNAVLARTKTGLQTLPEQHHAPHGAEGACLSTPGPCAPFPGVPGDPGSGAGGGAAQA